MAAPIKSLKKSWIDPFLSTSETMDLFHATIYLWIQGHHYIYTWFRGHQTNIILLCLLRFGSKQLDWCTKCTQLVYKPVLKEQSIHANVDYCLFLIVLTNILDSILSRFLSSTLRRERYVMTWCSKSFRTYDVTFPLLERNVITVITSTVIRNKCLRTLFFPK